MSETSIQQINEKLQDIGYELLIGSEIEILNKINSQILIEVMNENDRYIFELIMEELDYQIDGEVEEEDNIEFFAEYIKECKKVKKVLEELK